MNKIIVIVGPTAVGKTKLSIFLAKRLNGEIINADSTQIYKGLDIATAKVTKRETKNILHHLIDIKSINEKTKIVYSKFSNHDIEITYNPNLDKESFLDYLTNNQKTDILYKTTTSGPHRDDFTIKFNNNLAKVASQGEIRLIVISIKLG